MNPKKIDTDVYKTDSGWFKPGPGYKGNRGTKAFQDLADEYIRVVFGEDTLERLIQQELDEKSKPKSK